MKSNAKKRCIKNSSEYLIVEYKKAIKEGPDKVCCCCAVIFQKKCTWDGRT